MLEPSAEPARPAALLGSIVDGAINTAARAIRLQDEHNVAGESLANGMPGANRHRPRLAPLHDAPAGDIATGGDAPIIDAPIILPAMLDSPILRARG